MFIFGQPQRQTYPRIAATGTAAVYSAFFSWRDRGVCDQDMLRFNGNIDGDQSPINPTLKRTRRRRRATIEIHNSTPPNKT